jgi:hypothetical protein
LYLVGGAPPAIDAGTMLDSVRLIFLVATSLSIRRLRYSPAADARRLDSPTIANRIRGVDDARRDYPTFAMLSNWPSGFNPFCLRQRAKAVWSRVTRTRVMLQPSC